MMNTINMDELIQRGGKVGANLKLNGASVC